jgi:hypothetical protein
MNVTVRNLNDRYLLAALSRIQCPILSLIVTQSRNIPPNFRSQCATDSDEAQLVSPSCPTANVCDDSDLVPCPGRGAHFDHCSHAPRSPGNLYCASVAITLSTRRISPDGTAKRDGLIWPTRLAQRSRRWLSASEQPGPDTFGDESSQRAK